MDRDPVRQTTLGVELEDRFPFRVRSARARFGWLADDLEDFYTSYELFTSFVSIVRHVSVVEVRP